MNAISKDSALKFCELCNWVYEVWVTHKVLFDENNDTENTIAKAKYFTSRLSTITQEYALLQICKLHDPAIQGNSINLTIDYILRFGDLDEEDARIRKLAGELTELFQRLSSARNKILAHNDLEVLMDNTTLGSFPEDLDNKYFEVLQGFVNAVSVKWLSSKLYPFNDLAKADVDEFLEVLKRSHKNNSKRII